MNKRKSIVLAWSIVVLGLLIPLVPRLVVPLLWPYPYDDPFFDGEGTRFALLVAWNALPFVVLALGAYIALIRPITTERQRVIVLGGVLGALIPAIVLGLWIHTPNPNTVGFNFGVAFFPLYTLVLMPAGFGLGALLGRYRTLRAVQP
jgi:hypothetical protein